MAQPRAFAYVRFSTPEQLKGRSLERQTEHAATWCKANGILLDTELTLHDLGVSAFRGKNADVGALGTFLKAVHSGAVPRGSFLLVEAFDRMSRESAYDANLTLQNIIHAGITVVTLLDGKQYSVKILREDPLALIYAILLMSRGHEESATKSKRMLDAWRRKRQGLLKGQVLTARVPGWIRLDEKRRPRLVAPRAAIVRQIFRWFVTGESRMHIMRMLNEKRTPTFGGGRYWDISYITMILKNRAALGEFQAYREDQSHAGRIRKRVRDGAPIKDYYPAVVDARTFLRAQTLLARQAIHRVPRGRPLKNILAGLARCPKCDHLMTRAVKPKQIIYVCRRAMAGGDCDYKGVLVERIERTLIDRADEIANAMPSPAAKVQQEITAVEARLKTAEQHLTELAFLLDGTPSRTLAIRLQDAEGERDALQSDLERLRQKAAQSGALLARAHADKMRNALLWLKSSPTEIEAANAALRECFAKVVVDYASETLVMHWRHGTTTLLAYGRETPG